jgi:pimeloyl-ACP methyl ester carboxylesterase
MNQDIRFCTTADGVRLAYAVSGTGPPLVMSATWLTHLEHQWRSLAWRPWLDAFTREHKVLRYDSRGCGLSDRNVGDLSFETWVHDFERVIEAAGFRQFALVATCQGGPIAIEYAARHPERVSRLVLYGTYALGRLKWTDQPNEVEKARVLLDLTQFGWGRRTTLSRRSGPRTSSPAVRSTICAPGATSSAWRPRATRRYGSSRSAGTRTCAKPRARSNVRS